MTRWYIQIDMDGAIGEDEYAQLTEDDRFYLVHVDEEAGAVEATARIHAPGLVDALVQAAEIVSTQPTLRTLISAGMLSVPYRITVQDESAREFSRDLVTTKEVARLLGVSEGRVRQLKTEDPAFPKPVPDVPGYAGDVYRRQEILAYKGSRVLGQPGRPRKER